jgi:hypothetical protein
LTVCVSDPELVVSFASPLYVAVKKFDPTGMFVAANVATPLVKVPEPTEVSPSLKVTVPVAAAGVTVAVSVTLAPYVEGFSDDVSTVVEEALFTT